MLDKLIILTLIGSGVGIVNYVITFKNLGKNMLSGVLGAYAGGFFSQLLQIATAYQTPSLLTAWVFSISVILIQQIGILTKALSVQFDIKADNSVKKISGSPSYPLQKA